MLESTRNQLANASNRYQGNHRKVLCLCSAGMLRSPTMANVLHQEYGYNTRAAGTSMSHALIPVSQVLLEWADEVVFADLRCFEELSPEGLNVIKTRNLKVKVLNIPDRFDYGCPKLVEAIMHHYDNSSCGPGEL